MASRQQLDFEFDNYLQRMKRLDSAEEMMPVAFEGLGHFLLELISAVNNLRDAVEAKNDADAD